MPYTKTVWQSGDVISSEKLNKIEQGIEDASLDSGNSLKFVKDSEGSYEEDGETITYTGSVIEGMVSDDIPEEYRNKATGTFAHAEGGMADPENNEYYPNIASGYASHAEGGNTTASGDFSHAEGKSTIAYYEAQHVFGKYNIKDPSTDINGRGTYVEIVGNGTTETRSNARTLDWSGNMWLAGSLSLGNTTITEAQLQSLLALLNS